PVLPAYRWGAGRSQRKSLLFALVQPSAGRRSAAQHRRNAGRRSSLRHGLATARRLLSRRPPFFRRLGSAATSWLLGSLAGAAGLLGRALLPAALLRGLAS